MNNPTAISVKQLNLYVKSLLEGDKNLVHISVTGEISNFKNHYSSGHWYFTLKDADASVKCVMFRSAAIKVKSNICDGTVVTVRGRVSLYEKDGQFQFYVEELFTGGIGDLALLFEQTKQKLKEQGLFDQENKRPIPKFPKKIAVVTSATGAAVQDILNITGRRYPLCEIVLCPVSVQGESAVSEMIDALDALYQFNGIDLIIIGRGGGSAEDLAAFNDEKLALKIYESPFPVISAVGHETDFTICDFVADLRAPTPSAAAELAVPDMTELLTRLKIINSSLVGALKDSYKISKARLDLLNSSRYFKYPFEIIENKLQLIDRSMERLNINGKSLYDSCNSNLLKLVARLDALSPLKVLSRGFTVAEYKGHTVHSVKEISVGDEMNLKFSDGNAECLIKEIKYGNIEN